MATLKNIVQNTMNGARQFLGFGAGQLDEDPIVPYHAQCVGGVPVTLLNAVEADVALNPANAVVWHGGIGTLMAFADDEANGGDFGGGAVQIWIRFPGMSKWIQLADASGTALDITEDKAFTFTLARGVEIVAVLDGATSPDPVTVVIA